MLSRLIQGTLAIALTATLAIAPASADGTCKDEFYKVYAEARHMLATAASKEGVNNSYGGDCKILAESFTSVLGGFRTSERALESLPDTHQLWCEHAQMVSTMELQNLRNNLDGCL